MKVVPRRYRKHAAFSLLEMVLSLTVLAIVFTAVGSVFVLAAKVIPAPDSAEAASVDQSAALTRLVEDLQQARYITAGSANSVTFVVADRTGDGLPDRLAYAWSGTEGDPLTLTINGSTPVSIAQNVKAFTPEYTTEDRVDTVLGGNSADNVHTLQSYTVASLPGNYKLGSKKLGVGQCITPTLPAGIASYTVNRVRFRAKLNGGAWGDFYVCLYDSAGSIPSGTARAEVIVSASTLGSNYQWVEVVFTDPPTFARGDSFCLTVEWGSGYEPAEIEMEMAGGQGGIRRDKSTDPWATNGTSCFLFEAFGSSDSASPDIMLSRRVLTESRVTLQIGNSIAQTATARLYAEPGVHSAVWDAGFDVSPVGIDMDGNGDDWAIDRGGAAGSFANGVWTVDGRINIEPDHSFRDPVVVDVVMGCTANGQDGAKFVINADRGGGQVARLILQAGLDATGSHYVCLKNIPSNTVRLEATGLGPNLPRVRLLISPADDTVGLIVNGQPVGTYVYERESEAGIDFSALVADFSNGVIDSVSIRVGGTAVVTQP